MPSKSGCRTSGFIRQLGRVSVNATVAHSMPRRSAGLGLRLPLSHPQDLSQAFPVDDFAGRAARHFKPLRKIQQADFVFDADVGRHPDDVYGEVCRTYGASFVADTVPSTYVLG